MDVKGEGAFLPPGILLMLNLLKGHLSFRGVKEPEVFVTGLSTEHGSIFQRFGYDFDFLLNRLFNVITLTILKYLG